MDSIIYYCILPLLEIFRNLLGNYGWAIIAVTILTKLLLSPLSVKQILSSRKMQEKMLLVKPEIEKIKSKFELRKKKFEDQPEKVAEMQKDFQQQMMEIYQKAGIMNPLNGCLLSIAQIPILMALYWTFNGAPFQPSNLHIELSSPNQASTVANAKAAHSKVGHFIGEKGELMRFQLKSNIPDHHLSAGKEYTVNLERISKEDSPAGKLPKDNITWQLLPKNIKPDMNKDIVVAEADNAWTKDLLDLQVAPDKRSATIKADKATDKFYLQVLLDETRGHQSFFFVKDLGDSGLWDKESGKLKWDIAILLGILIVSFIVSSKLSMSMNSPSMPSLDESQEKANKQMQLLMPFAFAGIFLFFFPPAAVYLYLIVSNALQVAQTALTNKFIPAEASKDE